MKKSKKRMIISTLNSWSSQDKDNKLRKTEGDLGEAFKLVLTCFNIEDPTHGQETLMSMIA